MYIQTVNFDWLLNALVFFSLFFQIFSLMLFKCLRTCRILPLKIFNITYHFSDQYFYYFTASNTVALYYHCVPTEWYCTGANERDCRPARRLIYFAGNPELISLSPSLSKLVLELDCPLSRIVFNYSILLSRKSFVGGRLLCGSCSHRLEWAYSMSESSSSEYTASC
ncbi:hypothetical protein CRM22_003676 [Opisthorchis felineus]|uniref:Uncharacterized protein n=1 Tax=Opisthorchis felineus TaxID=147828 RepID=A0A4S2M054_OPIFE|nr:hypothetical protein CRM22_003676 [Opisthorchis felineus]